MLETFSRRDHKKVEHQNVIIMPTKEDIQLIIDYLDGNLQEAENEKTRRRIAGDPAFRKEYLIYKASIEGVVKGSAKNVRKDFLKWDRELESLKKARRISLQKWGYYAAAFVVLVLTTFMVFPSLNSEGEKVFSDFFEPYPNVIHLAERGNNQPGILTDAFEHYEKEEYPEARILMHEHLLHKQEHYEVKFYLALATLKSDQTDTAIIILEELANNQPEKFRFNEQVSWYLALAYIKDAQYENALKLLESFDLREGYYAKQVELLQKRLHRL